MVAAVNVQYGIGLKQSQSVLLLVPGSRNPQQLAAALLAPKGPSKQTPTDTDTNRYDSKRFPAIVFDTF